MELLADNWVPNHLLTRGDTFTKDTPKFFFMSPKLGAPRAYYMALAHREKLYEVAILAQDGAPLSSGPEPPCFKGALAHVRQLPVRTAAS
jgi:hypothetical protein